MALIEENLCICIKCEGEIPFCSSNENKKRRHVAIVHGKETFSSLRCGKCERKYYDFDHFAEHLQASPECRKDSWMIKPEPLTPYLEMAFAALVEQMMLPVKTDQTEKAPISADEILKCNMDGAKRKGVDDSSASVGTSSTKRQRGSATRTVNTIREGKRMKNKKASIKIRPVRKARKWQGQKRSKDADGSDGRGTEKTTAVDDPNNVRSSIVRREYCVELIDKFSTAGKLQCQLCKTTCSAFHTGNSRQGMTTKYVIQHALGHLKMPIYHCRICNVTKFTYGAMKLHIKGSHPNSEECYEDCSDQYHKEIMDILRLCYHVDKEKKRPVEQVEKRLTIPGRCYDDTRSPLHNERMHYVRSLAARYSNQTRIACQLCSTMCTVNRRSALASIRNHVFGHLNKDIFQCKLCQHRYQSYYQLKKHIWKYHRMKNIEGAFVDYSDKYHQEFVKMLGKCFDPDSGNGVVKSKKKVRSGINGTRKKATSGNGKTAGAVPTPADGKCFRCRHCQFRTKYEILMKKHSKVFHGH